MECSGNKAALGKTIKIIDQNLAQAKNGNYISKHCLQVTKF
jgi:hypothetical protein